ncbi:MAG: ribonuclease HII [Pseudomonadales bacterium]|jgi:ribonuclease HII
MTDPVLTAGVDEAGRGPLAGPVVAAAVILDPALPVEGLKDSKQLSPRRRDTLADEIRARALAVGVAFASVEEVDRLNILNATLLAMQRAVAALSPKPALVLVDGNRLPGLDMPARAVVRGDSLVAAISAASILAKVARDRWMSAAARDYPLHGFDVHKGYPTVAHRQALLQFGPTPLHRMSFGPVRAALQAHGSGARGGNPVAVNWRAIDPANGERSTAGDDE